MYVTSCLHHCNHSLSGFPKFLSASNLLNNQSNLFNIHFWSHPFPYGLKQVLDWQKKKKKKDHSGFSVISCFNPCAVLCSVVQSCPTLCNRMDCSPPGSSVHGISQPRIPEWAAVPSSRGIFPTQELNSGLPHCRWILYCLEPPRKFHRGNKQTFWPTQYLPIALNIKDQNPYMPSLCPFNHFFNRWPTSCLWTLAHALHLSLKKALLFNLPS